MRLSIDKQFQGDLKAVSQGEMLSAGTDALIGLAGSMRIVITTGKHSYEFECRLPDG